MNFEQIMIKLGIDGTAIKSGLGKVSAQVKAWGASLVDGFKSQAGSIMKGFLGAEAVSKAFEYLDRIKDKILTIARVSNETGANTNFIQSIMLQAEKAGVPFEKLTVGIARFNKTLGAAKMGNTTALKTLSDLGVASNLTEARTLTFTKAMHNLSNSFEKLNDKQKQAALLSQAFGRGYAELTPIFEQGTKAIDEMSNGSFFTKISAGSIGDFQTVWNSIKTGAAATMATVVNTIDIPFAHIRKGYQALGILSTGVLPGTKEWKQDLESLNKVQEEINFNKALEAQADKDGITVQELKTKLLNEQAELLEKQADLTAIITERDKESVAEMASRARKLTGIKGPLETLHTVTPRMRTALRIETLEERAKVAFLRGNDVTSNKLQSEADQIRKANPWLKRSDQNPMLKTEAELTRVNAQLEPVKRMADMVNSTSQ